MDCMKTHVRDYEVVQCMGEGGSGTVYVVIHPNTGAYLAMKEFANVQDGEREAAILLSLRIPGIPNCLDCFCEDGKYYLVMDYAKGRSLRECTGDKYDEKAKILMKLAGLISCLHTLSVPLVHGDLKPENVIVGDDGEVFLIDFGSAFRISNPPKAFKGSPGFAAPELREGKCTTESDVYSFGKLMLYLFCGRNPLPEYEEPKPGVLLRMGIRREHAKQIVKCLKNSPKERFHSMVEVTEKMRKKMHRAWNLSGFIIKLGAVLSFGGIWLYAEREWQKGKYLILAGCVLLVGEMLVKGYERRLSEEEFGRTFSVFLSE